MFILRYNYFNNTINIMFIYHMTYYTERRMTLKRVITIVFSKRGNASNTTFWYHTTFVKY